MRTKIFSLYLVFFLSSMVYADVAMMEIYERCSEQDMRTQQGLKRNAWAKKCFKHVNFDAYNNRDPMMYALVYSDSKKSWRGPMKASDSCGDWKLKAMCVQSCYPYNEIILFEDGYSAIGDAYVARKNNIVAMSSDSLLFSPEFVSLDVKSYTRSHHRDHEVLLEFNTQSGSGLVVTQGHPVLLSTGVMKEAHQLKIGDYLVRASGELDQIINIRCEDFWGHVYNIQPASGHPKENILVARDYLVGSAAYQFSQEFVKLMNRQIFRQSIDLDDIYRDTYQQEQR